MKLETNPVVAQAMSDFIGKESVLSVSKLTGISRITLNAWSRGQNPNLGVLLQQYFSGTFTGRRLAYKLLFLLHPRIAAILPEQAIVEKAIA